MAEAEDAIEVPASLRDMRRYALDGALMLFDRTSGLVAVCDGPETAHLRMRAPRVVQFAITNACNLACTFCSRDVDARSRWSGDDAFELLRDLSRAGTLEVAFGGGEPLAFKGFAQLVQRLHEETELAVSLTTNGTLLDDAMAANLAPYVGQVRLSVYDDVEHRSILRRLVENRIRFGINWLVTPERADALEDVALELFELGCRDLLVLSYTGPDSAMHLPASSARKLASRLRALEKALAGRMTLKLDVCWGERMEAVPQLFGPTACPAGREFVVITSDRMVSPCSFHHLAFPVGSARDVLDVWNRERAALSSPAETMGCARQLRMPASPGQRLNIVG